MEQEMGTHMSSGLNPEDEVQMESVILRVELAILHRNALGKQLFLLRADLKNNLEKRETRLLKQIAED